MLKWEGREGGGKQRIQTSSIFVLIMFYKTTNQENLLYRGKDLIA
jgi:hypothetical protein